MDKRLKLIILLCVSLALVLSGCDRNKTDRTVQESGYAYRDGGVYDYAYDAEEEMDIYVMEDSMAMAAAPNAVPAASNSGSAAQKRMIRKSASINIQVMDPIRSAELITALAEEMGGFVVSSSNTQERYSGNVFLPRADLTIRVPAERLNEMLAFIENQTPDKDKNVSNKRIYGVDITSEYVDSNSRLTSLERTLNKLNEILDTATNAEEALTVYESIADVESQIEVLKGQIKYMDESVALSSIEIVITSIRPDPIQTVEKWSPGEIVKDAFESLLDAVKGVIEFIIRFVIVVIPIIIMLAIPVVLIVLIIKAVLRKRNKKFSPKTKTEDPITPVVKK